jgi:two-component system response regulator (stage 0 sporulation protein A)
MTKFEKTVEALRRCVPQAAFDKAMAEINAEEGPTKPVSKDPDDIIRDLLVELGVPDHVKGHKFIVEALRYTVKHSDSIPSVSKELYPAVAKTFRDTPSRVERAIRHAIEVAWDRGDLDTLQRFFGYTVSNTKGKPTNSEFIALIADKLQLQMRSAGVAY